jgi:hypothetical protein
MSDLLLDLIYSAACHASVQTDVPTQPTEQSRSVDAFIVAVLHHRFGGKRIA